MVWFHGGAFSYGTANAARLQGTRLAKRGDVVVVTVNQRLNIFGFLDLSAVGGPAFAQSGNAGTLDMVAALEWVRDNIERFGGDPGNITIFGESGGGAKVCTLLAMPLARGLFHRAIVQSGAAVRLREPERAARLTDAVLQHLGLTGAQLDHLQALPAAQLLAAVGPAQKAICAPAMPLLDRYPFGPVVDGEIVPHHPFDPAAPDVSADIPLLIGDMKDETASFLAPDDKVWHRTLTE
jgi:para-nitrobenzyl esterase